MAKSLNYLNIYIPHSVSSICTWGPIVSGFFLWLGGVSDGSLFLCLLMISTLDLNENSLFRPGFSTDQSGLTSYLVALWVIQSSRNNRYVQVAIIKMIYKQFHTSPKVKTQSVSTSLSQVMMKHFMNQSFSSNESASQSHCSDCTHLHVYSISQVTEPAPWMVQ